MDFTMERLEQIPPLVAVSGTKLTVCGSRHDIHTWLKAENIHRSNAFLIHDPCGCLHSKYKNVLRRYGYEVNVFEPTGCGKSVRYNPFSYIKDDGGISKLAAAVMRGTKGSGENDYGFTSAETLLLTALIGYLHENAPDYELNFRTVLEMLNNMESPEDWDDDYKTAVGFLFEAWERRDPSALSVRRYNHFKTTPYKNDGKLYASCKARLAPLATKQAADFMSADGFGFDALGLDKLFYLKIAVFVRTGKDCYPLGFLTPLLYSQFFDMAYEHITE